MTGIRSRAWCIASCLTLSTTAVSCAQVFDYPEVEAEHTASRCGDGKDNDLDGKADCEDSECKLFCLENTEEMCHDRKDNDFDGNKDCEASDCAAYCVESTDETCHDGQDNDQNTQIDCADPACGTFCPEANARTCADNTDNDSDSKTDCEDSDCDGFCPEESPADCNDQRDNDGDGLRDAADPRCWLHAAPKVQRCAQANGVEIVETFDVPTAAGAWIFSEWASYGAAGSSPGFGVFAVGFHSKGSVGPREDGMQVFNFNTTRAETLDDNLGELVRTWQFSGTWQGFELSFNASVPLGAMLRVGIVPAELAPLFEPTLPGAENALVALTLDGAHVPATFTLDVSGRRVAVRLPLTRSLCAGGIADCALEDMSKVRVVLDDRGFYATVERPNGERAELRGPPPSSLAVPPSRLVFWAGTTAAATVGLLDDVHMRVAPAYPCGFPTPQIPGRACEWRAEPHAFGRVVSLARAGDDDYCALVTASGDEPARTTERLTAWQSSHGEVWTPASSPDAPPVVLPPGASLVGAGIAHDAAGFHVAVAYREGPSVRLGMASGPTCGMWGPLTAGPALFPDAEAPSYVIVDGQHAVYFTRPPTDETLRTLWRSTRTGSELRWLEPELLSELPANAASPVSVQRIGARDLVLAHPTAVSGGTPGVGLLVGSSQGRLWRSLSPSPILDIPKRERNYNGALAFDDQGVLAATLDWNQNGGFLLYGASSPTGLNTGEQTAPSELSVGTARIVPADQSVPGPTSELRASCGDHTCDADETCSTCPEDCSCTGPLLLSNVFSADQHWQVLSSSTLPVRAAYVDLDHAALNWAKAKDTWATLALERTIVGDFELSFDLRTAYVDPSVAGSCSAYVGLASVRDSELLAQAGGAAIEAGIFARFTYGESACFWQYSTTPVVQTGAVTFSSPVARDVNSSRCEAQDHYWSVETRRRVVLRREGKNVTMDVARDDSCGLSTQTIEYSGALPDLGALLVGFGGGLFAPCDDSLAYGTITNLELRLLDDPTRCPDTKMLCGGATEQPSCVDTNQSSEHCGGCGHACAANETCGSGRCVCSTSKGILSCHDKCVDSLIDIANCGSCDNACEHNCVAGVCDVVTGDCSSPIPLPAAGGKVGLDFSTRKPDLVPLCSGSPAVRNLEVFSWTPSQSGLATITVHQTRGVATLVSSITVDPSCSSSSWLTCGRGGSTGDEVPIMLPVVAGTTYRIAVGLATDDPMTSAELTVQVEQ